MFYENEGVIKIDSMVSFLNKGKFELVIDYRERENYRGSRWFRGSAMRIHITSWFGPVMTLKWRH